MRSSVAIIGAGFSGTLTAIQLADTASTSTEIDIYLIDPRESFGPGLAYTPPSKGFKLNVPAKSMGAFPDDVEGFYRWIYERDRSISPEDFAPRLLYGAYLEDLLNQASSRSTGHTIHRVRDEVINLRQTSSPERWELTLNSGSSLVVDACVLAMGNLMPTAPATSKAPLEFRQPFSSSSYDDLSSRQKIFILGSSLTAVDVILECEARGFTGSYTVLSRNGRFPRPHESLPSSAVAHLPHDWDTRGSARSLTSLIRAESRRLGSSQPVFDAMRPKIQSMWKHLPPSERKRFLRHVRPIWDIHRHRIPASHADVLARLQATNRLRIIAGRLHTLDTSSSKFSCVISKRGQPLSASIEGPFDVAFRCTGPEGDITKSDHPLLRNLHATGLLLPGPLGLGPLCATSDTVPLWLVGPLQREVLWEITAVREIREHAHEVARQVVRHLEKTPTA